MIRLDLKVHEFLAGPDEGGRNGIAFVTVQAILRLPELRFASADRKEDWE